MLAPLRTTGLAGAFAGYAEGVDAIAANAAAAALREPYSTTWFDYDLTLGISFPATFRNTDFDNDGSVGFKYQNFLFYTLGASVKIGAFGAGILGDFQRYELLPPDASPSLPHTTVTLGRLHAVGGASLFGAQLAIAGGLRVATLNLDESKQGGGSSTVLSMSGAAPEIGFLLRPDYQPWRIGATYRMAVEGTTDQHGVIPGIFGGQGQTTPTQVGAIYVPAGVRLPWEVEAGFALQVGPRPLNPKWIDPSEQEDAERRQIEDDRAARKKAEEMELAKLEPAAMFEQARKFAAEEARTRAAEEDRLKEARKRLLYERKARYANWPRERITFVGELLLTGPSKSAVDVEYFLTQLRRESGASVSVAPRVGLEGEPIVDLLQTRIGTYIEPSRFSGQPARQHFTFGFDVRLGAWSMFGIAGDQVWRVTGAVDLSPRYENFGLSIGAWH